MKIHFFQRYHSKENVDTANAMLLLSRLYSYSPTKFFDFIAKILPENVSIELSFNLQEKSINSCPDATISQPSFKIVIETKLYGNFDLAQLECHLQAFANENYKVLLTLDPSLMALQVQTELVNIIKGHNTKNESNIIHKHLTFEELINNITEIIDDRDYDIQDILEDYRKYCYTSNLIPNDWKRMRVQLASTTIDINKKLKLYYENVSRGFSGHNFLGLYNQKAVQAIGEITAIATAIPNGNHLDVEVEKGILTEEMKSRINEAIEDAKNYGYDLINVKHRYFFVDKFYDTCFEKSTLYAPRGSRIFDLCEVLEVEKLPDVQEIAEKLKQKKWT